MQTDPEDLTGDVGNPVLFQCVAFGVLHQICDGPGATELHHQLEERTGKGYEIKVQRAAFYHP